MKGNLEARQAEMRARMAQQTQKCANKDCTHQARKGQAYCSRCTTKAIQEKLRDTLPGVISAATPKPVAETTGDGRGPSELEQNKDDARTDTENVHVSPSLSNEPSPVEITGKQYTRKEAAKLIGIGYTTLMKWEKKGVCRPRHIAFGNKYIYSEDEIEKARVYKNSEIPFDPTSPSTTEGTPRAGTLDSFAKQRGAKFALGKKVEKSVAKQLGSIGGRLV